MEGSSSPLIAGKTSTQWFAEAKARIEAGTFQPTELGRPRSFRNAIVEARVHGDRDKFIASIRDDQVLRLAASHHGGDDCTFFKPPVRGSYNICYFVQFRPCKPQDSDDRWVVRLPLNPTLAFGPRRKLESEVATMRLLAEKTTIPVPKIHAFAISDGPEPFPSYLILDYVEGQKLHDLTKLSDEQRARLYTSLADVYIQLRRLEFPSIGCLTRGDVGPEVGSKVVSIDLNMQELEGLAPSEIIDSYYGSDGILDSADDYTAMLLQIAHNAFVKGCGAASQEEGEDELYHMHMFSQFARDWVDHKLDRGPFVLVHGDLQMYNLLLDHDMNIVSVFDWEWSRVVPLQYFKPPLWFSNTRIEDLSYGFRFRQYLEVFDPFLAVLRAREKERYGNELLADEWNRMKLKSGFMVANALEMWTAMEWFADRYINLRVYGTKEDTPARVAAFVQEDPARKDLVEKKVLDWSSYSAELGRQT